MVVFKHLSEIVTRGYSFEITPGLEGTINVAIFDTKGNVDGFQVEQSFIKTGECSEGFIRAKITRALKRLERK